MDRKNLLTGRRLFPLCLALLLAIEPLALEVHQAQAMQPPQPRRVKKLVDVRTDPASLVLPPVYLQQRLAMLGKNQQDIETKSYADAFQLISQSVNLLDDSSTDAIGFYAALSTVLNIKGTLATYGQTANVLLQALDQAAPALTLFFVRQSVGPFHQVVQKFFRATAHMTERLQGVEKIGGIINDLLDPAGLASNRQDLCQWFAKSSATDRLGAARQWGKRVLAVIGIVAEVLNLGMAITALNTSESLSGGARGFGGWTYEEVKNGISALGSVVSLFCMACLPPAGTIASLIFLAVTLTLMGFDAIGNQRKKWLEAYRNSHWFLYTTDKNYKLFFDNPFHFRGAKSLLWMRADTYYRNLLAKQSPEAGKVAENLRKVQAATRDQGILMTWYQSRPAPTQDLSELKDLYRLKADYMQWKPTQAEATRVGKSNWDIFWEAFGRSVGYINDHPAMDDRMRRRLQTYQHQYCYFNPDFLLYWKFIKFATAQSKGGKRWIEEPFPSLLFLRIQEAPFHYLPLLETDAWSLDLLRSAFQADAFLCGIKHLAALQGMVKGHVEKFSALATDLGKNRDKSLANYRRIAQEREALHALLNLPDVQAGLKKLREAKIIDQATERNLGKLKKSEVIDKLKPQLEHLFMDRPGCLAYAAADCVISAVILKQHCDVATILQRYGEFRGQALKKVANLPVGFQKMINEGKLLNLQQNWGESLQNFLGGVEPPAKEYLHYLNLYKSEVSRYLAKVREPFTMKISGKGGKSIGGYVLSEDLKKYNDELGQWKALSAKMKADYPALTIKWHGHPTMWGPYKIPVDYLKPLALPAGF